MRLRNSIIVEVILLVLSVTVSNWVWREHLILKAQTWYASPAGEDMHLTAAGFWYVGVSLTILRFMLYRWYFRILLWYQFLWRVRGLPLHLNLFHPDRAAGLGFLSVSMFAFAPILVAVTFRIIWRSLSAVFAVTVTLTEPDTGRGPAHYANRITGLAKATVEACSLCVEEGAEILF